MKGGNMPEPTPTPDQLAETERVVKPPEVSAEDLDVEPGDAAQVRGGFTPVPIPSPEKHN